MSDESKGSREWISVRVKPEEYNIIYAFYEGTTCRKLSEYVRLVLLRKPVIVNYRNQSAAEFLELANQLKNELNAIGNNYNQAVKRLHSINSSKELKTWILLFEAVRPKLDEKIEGIRLQLNQIYDIWSHK